jgi:hypothetical protein
LHKDLTTLRLASATLFAVTLAVALTVTTTAWHPLCVLYDVWDAMYWILGCWDGPPPSPMG